MAAVRIEVVNLEELWQYRAKREICSIIRKADLKKWYKQLVI